MNDYNAHTTLYDVIVIGAGHAGCEAANAAARMGTRTLLLTIDLDKTAHMSCNPSIGGPAKGHIVREVDALGGLMGRVTDQTSIQIRLLNESKGPAVQALRAQADKRLYAKVMKEMLENVPNLDLKQAMVERIVPIDTISNNGDVPSKFAVVTHTGRAYYGRTLVLTTGTFLRGRAITGEAIWGAGRAGEAPAVALGQDLASFGFPLVRLKTGTPPRIDARTIDFTQTEVQFGSTKPLYFAHYYDEEALPQPHFTGVPSSVYPQPMLDSWWPQLPCYLVHSSAEFHNIVRENIERAPMFSGVIEGVGPRYCPSIEDKITRFADKESHGMFLEPEGWHTNEVYVQGCNTSLPEDVQWSMLRTIPALRNVELMRVGYAIEYDAIATGEITADLSTKRIPGLFLAGQINGTTGYEEAAAQGLMAGINAARTVQQQPPIILRRDQAYIGVLIDDLVTKEIHEPYRMFTSRAEHRLLLRNDNADLRLTVLAGELGLVDANRVAKVEEKREQTETLLNTLRKQSIFPSEATNTQLKTFNMDPIQNKVSVDHLLRRPHIRYAQLQEMFDLPDAPKHIIEQVEIVAKYGSYIEKQQRETERVQRMENRRLPSDFDYNEIPGLRNEARHVFIRFRPATLGQASRLAGINPTDIAIVLFALERISRRSTETSEVTN
ncbi:MAG: tRNA uridine-5-carboxymethylaminomethyl(34) synthesis enzyme MnmG [Chloroflexi bacterium AL-W]|nr:tRNA uridine-5-carboxymethylaminomethyl(34) synthesis enzyme MnmG [Chloroflexi bacterium AL-N1]NOK65063.1 tRNA uridine-5-carboxymethylaminomethyl(34) synthesis enzyme MnmG [Chloroflexi bacterium AL-N10]NOK72670.1 tRNA uridine-5-carboxymethylaminomethyl(34) synthesis enzyme MnmG [Chloroflexi bacterium AL-N5]NOK79242.1 tRNA uridine-5-carboxymethylaminomethyl(34) synthesis enzyme MnmG [Chloroflexi bacterium AL-W]NOK87158.1 tRNA uridine-5-carboxymethylaminomethyl(34) synthesis enzyme MnmG [Chlor